jgi:branched-chain amino acid transport system ATP-binding protein
MTTAAGSFLGATEIVKRFAGIVALDGVSLAVRSDETVGLIGPNGAGKTTLFNCILGVLRPERGSVTFDGADISRLPIHQRSRLGMARTFQRMELFATMSPREHLLVTGRARSTRGGILRDLIGRGRPTAEERATATELLELVGLAAVADAPVESLSLGQGRLVELARALMCQPRIVLLDEPSSGLDRAETAAFAEVISAVRAETKASVLIVEHDLELVMAVADRLYCMDVGRMIAEGSPESVLADPAVRMAYLGVSA